MRLVEAAAVAIAFRAGEARAASGARMPGSRSMPPSDTRQKGLRTASTCRAGSPKPMERPMTGLTPQLQTGARWVVGVFLLVAEVGDARCRC